MHMQNKQITPVITGVVIMLLAGFIYAWSIIAAPISASFPQWNSAQLSLTFTVCMIFFCLGGVASGMLSAKFPVRVNLTLSAILFLIGFFLSSRAESLGMLYVSYGVFCGVASGIAYNSVLNTVPRWYPQKQGLITGILLMGFGSSGLVVGTLFTASLSTTNGDSWRTSLLSMGIILAVIILVGAQIIKLPDTAQQSQTPIQAKTQEGLDVNASGMLRRPSFWIFSFWVVGTAAAGLVLIAQARSVALLVAPELSLSFLSILVGSISVCNGLGRILFGALFDRLGHRKTIALVSFALLAGLCALLLCLLTKSFVLLVCGFILGGIGYGGSPTMSAAFIKFSYGQRHYAVNLSVANLSILLASFASTGAGAVFDATGSFILVFIILLVFVFVALLGVLQVRKP